MNKYIDIDLSELENNFEFFDDLKNKSVMVTGGTGLIGKLILQFLYKININHKLNMNIIGVARDKKKIESLGIDIKWIVNDLESKILLDGKVDYIIHTASPTQSNFLSRNPVEVIKQTVNGAINLLEFARQHETEGFVYLSSVEVYGENFTDTLINEQMLGKIDILNPRSSYPEGKKLIECLCASFYHEYGLNVKIARLTQTFGCGIAQNDNRVFAQFIRSIINDEEIVLHTTGKSAKKYIYTIDAINAIFYILFRGESAEAYNVASDDSYFSIKEMAEFLINRFNDRCTLKIELKDGMGYAPVTRVNLDTSKLKKLGWKPIVSFEKMYSRTIGYLMDENLLMENMK